MEADAVGPVVVVFELSPVVRALGTHHLGEDEQEGLGAPGEAGVGEGSLRATGTGGRQSKIGERDGGRDRRSLC